MTDLKPEDIHIESTYDIEGTLFFGLWIDLHTNNKEKVADVKKQILDNQIKAEKWDKIFHGHNQVNKALYSMVDDLIKEEEKTKQLEAKIKELEEKK